MLTLTMRREDRPNRVPVTSASDEFVDILQVQQLLLNDNRREVPPAAAHQPPGRILENFSAPGYYYGGYQPPQPASASVDDLVAMWFAGPSTSGLPKTRLSQSKPRVPTLDGRIVGGADADIADYPYQLVLQYNNRHFCGAAIIAPTWAVTAGHCVDDEDTWGLSVRAGSTRKSAGGQTVTVSKIFLHPRYDYWELDYDIAVLQLSAPITAPNASPAALPEPDSPIPNGANAIISGWGTLVSGGNTPEILQVVEVPVVSQLDCRRAYGASSVTDRMFCAGLLGVGGKDACQGDSGGPVIVDGVLTGLVSWGYGCADANYPGVYTNVRSLRSFIAEVTGL